MTWQNNPVDKCCSHHKSASLADLIRKNENIKTVVYEDKRYSDLIDLKWIFVLILAFLGTNGLYVNGKEKYDQYLICYRNFRNGSLYHFRSILGYAKTVGCIWCAYHQFRYSYRRGTIRDVLIGYTPVTWMRDYETPLIILGTGIATIFFKKYIKTFKTTLFLFDAFGLGLFTIIGIQKGIGAGLNPGVCVALGTITGCFGGVLRDILLNNIPLIFQKEIYATACIIGGTLYILLIKRLDTDIVEILAVAIVCAIRIVAVKYKLSLPKFYG